MPTLTAREISITDLESQFNLHYTDDLTFFSEWQENLPLLSDAERERCDRIKTSFSYLLRYPPLLENTVKMVVLSGLLDMAGFYLPPFHIQSETSTEIIDQDQDLTVKGSLDVLVLCQSFWVLVIESKRATFSLEVGRSQLLAYLLASPQIKIKPIYGLLTNGSNFVFLKLAYQNNIPTYTLSDEFIIHNRENGLYSVLQILKRLALQVTS
jgi:hypothetical protein